MAWPFCQQLRIQTVTLTMTQGTSQDSNAGSKPAARHVEGSDIPTDTAKIHNGDAALALFENLEDMHEGFEPGEEKKLVRKIDLMILPFLAVCYAFYYVGLKHSHKDKEKQTRKNRLIHDHDTSRLTKQRCRMLQSSGFEMTCISLARNIHGSRVSSTLASWRGRFPPTY
jgi:hypothetical protein